MPSNMMFDVGNMINSAGCIIGARSGLMTNIAAAADVAVVRNILQVEAGKTRPMGVSQIRMRFLVTTDLPAVQSIGFQIHKVTGFTATDATSAITVAAQRRKNSAYVAIPETEIETVIANTGALATQTYTAADANAPIEVFSGGGLVNFAFGARWVPVDYLPLVLEANEGLVVKLTNAMPGTGAGRLFLGVDFFRF